MCDGNKRVSSYCVALQNKRRSDFGVHKQLGTSLNYRHHIIVVVFLLYIYKLSRKYDYSTDISENYP